MGRKNFGRNGGGAVYTKTLKTEGAQEENMEKYPYRDRQSGGLVRTRGAT
jgi:predicted outer membrane repeat protein